MYVMGFGSMKHGKDALRAEVLTVRRAEASMCPVCVHAKQ